MDNVAKRTSFQKELEFIKSPTIKFFAECAIEMLPDYFFEIPASSTSRYHPSYALGVGGLLRHTRAAIRIAVELSRLDWWHFTDDEMDLMITALLVHDGWKSGENHEKFTITEHPLVARKMLESNADLMAMIPQEQIDIVLSGITHHMGQWVFDYKTKEKVLDRPETKFEKFIHLADYLASRKCLEMNFDVELSKS
jgi:hypothetical protein